MLIKIYWGNYTFNTRTLVVKRAKPGMGTHVGRELTPFKPTGCAREYICPHVNGVRYYTTISKLQRKYR